MYLKKEVRDIAITILVLAFVFGFDDKQPTFRLGFWLMNLLRFALIASTAVIVHDIAHKFVASRYSIVTKYRLWGVQHIWFHERRKIAFRIRGMTLKEIPIGIVLALLITFYSMGRFFFIALESFELFPQKHRRMGRRFLEVTDLENGFIALSGPIANMMLAFLFRILNLQNDVVIVNSLFALFHMLPISSLDGAKVFFGSRVLYVLGLSFILFLSIFLQYAGAATGLALSIVLAVIAVVVFFLLYNKDFFK